MGELEEIVIGAIKDNTSVVEQILNGKESAKEFLVGQVMRETLGKADPKLTRELINKLI